MTIILEKIIHNNIIYYKSSFGGIYDKNGIFVGIVCNSKYYIFDDDNFNIEIQKFSLK